MPRLAMDYSKTVIYHFVCQDKAITCSYVGSTTNFVKRKCGHKTVCHNEKLPEYKLKLYQTIRDNGGWTNWSMVPLEEFACENSTQQVMREQYWIDQIKPELNCYNAFVTEEDLKEYNKERRKIYCDTHKEQIKIYHETHKEEIREYRKKYEKEHAEEISQRQKKYRIQNIEMMLEREQINRDKRKEKRNETYKANRDKINEKRRELYKSKKETISHTGAKAEAHGQKVQMSLPKHMC